MIRFQDLDFLNIFEHRDEVTRRLKTGEWCPQIKNYLNSFDNDPDLVGHKISTEPDHQPDTDIHWEYAFKIAQYDALMREYNRHCR